MILEALSCKVLLYEPPTVLNASKTTSYCFLSIHFLKIIKINKCFIIPTGHNVISGQIVGPTLAQQVFVYRCHFCVILHSPVLLNAT